MFGKTRALYRELLAPLEALNGMCKALNRIDTSLRVLADVETARLRAEINAANAAELHSIKADR